MAGKIKPVKFLIKIIFLLLAIFIIFNIGFLLGEKKKENFIFKIDNYTFSANSNEVFSKDGDGFNVSPQISSIGKDSCLNVAGVVYLSLDKKVKGDYHDSSERYSFTAWNLESLGYKSASAKNSALERIAALENLKNYTDRNKIVDWVFSDSSRGRGITLEPWMGFAGCGGSLSYPIYVQKVEQNKFDIVLYAEALEGQESEIFLGPVRFLIIKKNNDWLIVKEYENIGQSLYEEASKICKQEKGNEIAGCVENIWAEKFRNQTDNKKWINYFLDAVDYYPVRL